MNFGVHLGFLVKLRTVLGCGTRADLEWALSREGLGVRMLPWHFATTYS